MSLKPYLLFHQEGSTIYLVHALSTNMQTFGRGQAATSYSSLSRRTRLAHRCTSCLMPRSEVLQLWQRLKSPSLISVSACCTFTILNLNHPVCTLCKYIFTLTVRLVVTQDKNRLPQAAHENHRRRPGIRRSDGGTGGCQAAPWRCCSRRTSSELGNVLTLNEEQRTTLELVMLMENNALWLEQE